MAYADFPVDLHGHTTRSDGYDTPREFIHHAIDRKMRIAAITDHDKIPPLTIEVAGQMVDTVGYAKSLGLDLILGTEISCETYVEEVHLVCFGCDWEADFFRELDDFVIHSKVESYKELVRRLNDRGMTMSWEEVLTFGGQHIPECDVQKKMIFNLMAAKGYTSDWSEAKMMVKRNKDLTIFREKPAAADVIHEVHRQGGIVILAHPYLLSDTIHYQERTMHRDDFIDHLIYEGLDGIEARYTYNKTSYAGALTKEEIYHEIIRKYAGRVRIISGGSDYHNDGKKGTANPRAIGECGLTLTEFYGNPILAGMVK